MNRDMLADLDAEDEEFDEYDDFDFDAEAAARRQERDAKTDQHRASVLAMMQALGQSIERLTAAQMDLQRVQAETLKAIHALGSAVQHQSIGSGRGQAGLAQAIDALRSDMRDIMTAPRELVRDKDGKPVGVKIKHG